MRMQVNVCILVYIYVFSESVCEHVHMLWHANISVCISIFMHKSILKTRERQQLRLKQGDRNNS